MRYDFSPDSAEKKPEPKKFAVVSMFTHKGGVGKITGTQNLAALLAQKGARVLLVDADPQCNLSKDFIKAKVTSLFPQFQPNVISKLQRKVARLFTKWGAREGVGFVDYKLKIITEGELTSEEIEVRFSKEDLSKNFIIYQRSEPVKSQSGSSPFFAVNCHSPKYLYL